MPVEKKVKLYSDEVAAEAIAVIYRSARRICDEADLAEHIQRKIIEQAVNRIAEAEGE